MELPPGLKNVFFVMRLSFTTCSLGLHMGPNNLCYVTHHFLFFPYVPVTFYKTLTSLSTFFIKGHVGLLQLLKWPCRTFVFYPCGALRFYLTLYLKNFLIPILGLLRQRCSFATSAAEDTVSTKNRGQHGATGTLCKNNHKVVGLYSYM